MQICSASCFFAWRWDLPWRPWRNQPQLQANRLDHPCYPCMPNASVPIGEGWPWRRDWWRGWWDDWPTCWWPRCLLSIHDRVYVFILLTLGCRSGPDGGASLGTWGMVYTAWFVRAKMDSVKLQVCLQDIPELPRASPRKKVAKVETKISWAWLGLRTKQLERMHACSCPVCEKACKLFNFFASLNHIHAWLKLSSYTCGRYGDMALWATDAMLEGWHKHMHAWFPAHTCLILTIAYMHAHFMSTLPLGVQRLARRFVEKQLTCMHGLHAACIYIIGVDFSFY